MLVDSQMQPQNSWARFRAEFTSTGSFLNQDELSFYFFWQNDAASDAVVNVSSSMMLTGHWWVWAESGMFWSPVWGVSTIGRVIFHLNVDLSLKSGGIIRPQSRCGRQVKSQMSSPVAYLVVGACGAQARRRI